MSIPWRWKRKRDDFEEEVATKYSKIIHYKSPTIECHLSPICSLLKPFSIKDYDLHYQQVHVNQCSQCLRILPTKHLLHLHLLETHDSYFDVLKDRQPMYECFVDDCKLKFKDGSERINHLIDIHCYPENFDFDVIGGERDVPKKGRKSKSSKSKAKDSLKKDGVSSKGSKAKNTLNEDGLNSEESAKPVASQPMDVDEITEKISKLMVPRSVQFRHKPKRS